MFKVGDKVRVANILKNHEDRGAKHLAGQVCTIKVVYDSSASNGYVILKEEGIFARGVWLDELELIDLSILQELGD